MAGFAGLVYFVVPTLVFCVTGETWDALLERPRWQFVLSGLVLAPVGAATVQAVREFAASGGTPVPLDPPARLVTTGPYAYVANPMQLGGTILLAAWGVLLSSPAVVAAAAMAAVFSAGFARWSEDHDLAHRFGDDWRRYRRHVRVWIPRWRPYVPDRAVLYVASSCDPCREVGGFVGRLATTGLEVARAEGCATPLRRITYCRGGERAAGFGAIGRSLEHANLAWAAAGWIARLPGVEQLLQLITDAVGGGPRTIVQDGAARVPLRR
jgi:protein-S-isoprenylcysteine O-methyltransferase Ste14